MPIPADVVELTLSVPLKGLLAIVALILALVGVRRKRLRTILKKVQKLEEEISSGDDHDDD